MHKFTTPRGSRIAAALVVASALAAAPVVAQADTTTATGTVSAGGLSVLAPNHAVHRGSDRRQPDRQQVGGGRAAHRRARRPSRIQHQRLGWRSNDRWDIDCWQPRQPRGYAATSAADASNPAPCQLQWPLPAR